MMQEYGKIHNNNTMGSRSALHDIQSATHMARAVVGVGGAAGWSHDFEC